MKKTYEQTQPVGQTVTTSSSSGQSQQAQPTEPRGLNERILNDLAGYIGDKWTNLAIRLGFKDADIENFRADYPRSQKEQTFQMLKTWWQRWDHLHDADGSGARDALCDALENSGRKDLVLCLGRSVDGAGHFDPDPYRDEFIRYYQDEMSVVPLLPWLPSNVSSIGDIYVKLKLHERQDEGRKVKKREIDSHEDLLKLEYKDGKSVRFILLSGIAGSGKTTIVSKIATEWAEQKPGSPLSKFTFLVALSMRELQGVSDLTEAIYDQILAEDEKLSRQFLTNYLSSHAEKVLVVLDGADEYDKEGSQLPSEGFINKIISNKILRGCTVLVTTRPHMVDKLYKLQPSFIHIETRGFSDEGVHEYIRKFIIGEDPKMPVGLFGYLKASRTLLSLARTPIMLLLMCFVWSDEQKLPETLTELFKEALVFILKRHFQKIGVPNPEDKELLDNEVINLVKALGGKALDGLMLPGQKLVFEAGDFGNDEAVDEACKIGIVSKEKNRSQLRAVESVTFFHKTFQEAIAGFYWASLVESDEKLFNTYLSKVNMDNALGMEYVMRFCCGGNVKAAESLLRYVADTFSWDTEIPDFPNHLRPFRDSDKPFRRLWILMHFEAHSKELHRIAGTVFNNVFLVNMDDGNDIKTALKFLVECATSSNQSFLYKLKQVLIRNVTFKEDASLLTKIFGSSPNVTYVHIDLKKNPMQKVSRICEMRQFKTAQVNEVEADVYYLGEALSRMQSLVKLWIDGDFVDTSVAVVVIFNKLSQPCATSLNTLELDWCLMNRRVWTDFFSNQSELCELTLKNVCLKDDKCPPKRNALEGIETKNLKLVRCDGTSTEILSLGNSYPNLMKLHIVGLTTSEIIRRVCEILFRAPQLRVVEVRDVTVFSYDLWNLASALKRLQNLQELKLYFWGNGVCTEFLITFAKDVLPSLCNLRVLYIFEKIGKFDKQIQSSVNQEAFLSIVQWACDSTSIDELNLTGCVRCVPGHTNVSEPVSVAATNVTQPTPSSIEGLSVSSNILGPYTAAFIRLLKQMPFLKDLHMDGMHLAKSDWTDLVEVLNGCKQLQNLNLGKNFMESRDLESVLRLIPSLPDLRRLSLPKVSGQPTQMVHDCFQCGQRNSFLSPTCYEFDRSGIAALVKVVKQYDTE